MTEKNQPKSLGMSLEQKQALTRFAAKHGRTWRARLRQVWATGQDERIEDGALLRQVRNEYAHALNSFVPGV